jgi:pimeloyl-ACP methyl ester carboxylesterase
MERPAIPLAPLVHNRASKRSADFSMWTEPEDNIASARTMTVRVGASMVRYQVQGHGDPLVLVHGLAGSTAWWKRNVNVFSRKYTVYLIDLPGFGAMRGYANQFSVAGAASWLADLRHMLNIGRVAMVGHSMGGLITAMFAARWPERLTKIVLAAPAIALPRKKIPAFFIPLAREALYMRPRFVPTLVSDSVRAGYLTLLRAGHELLNIDIDDELSKINTECLLVWGQRDPLVPFELSRAIQEKIRNSELHVLPGAGHILMYDRADEFNRLVLKFLAGSAGSELVRS